MCFLLLASVLLLSAFAQSQEATGSDSLTLSSKMVVALGQKAANTEKKLDQATTSYLNKLYKQEKRLQKKLAKRDSALANLLFSDLDKKYAAIKSAPARISKKASVYSGHLDSLSTALIFLKS